MIFSLGSVLRQINGIPMGTYCASLIADLFLFCYEGDFMAALLLSLITKETK